MVESTLTTAAVRTRALWDSIQSQRRERVRRRIVRLIFIIYFLLIFEGAIRKWLLPHAEQLLYFVRIPFTLWLYGIVLWYGAWPRNYPPLLLASVLAVVGLALIPIQLLVGEYPFPYLLIAGYGWVNYFFYIPLAFLIGEHFRRDDLNRLVRFAFVIALIDAPLMLAQFESPAGSVLNVGASDDAGESKFGSLASAFGHIRPAGFFTSGLGQGTFFVGLTVMVLSVWLGSKKNRPVGLLFLVLTTLALLVMFTVAQDRTATVEVAAILLASAVAGLVTNRNSVVLKSLILPGVIVLFAVVLWPLISPESYDTFVTRVTGAAGSEAKQFKLGSFGRILFQFYAWTSYLNDVPITGFLLGIAGSVSYTLTWVQHPRPFYYWSEYGGWGEDGWSRHIIELGPVIGILFIAFRLYFAVWLGKRAISATFKSKEATPVVWWGIAGTLLIVSLMMSHGTVNGFGWIYCGLCLAASRICSEEHNDVRLLKKRDLPGRRKQKMQALRQS